MGLTVRAIGITRAALRIGMANIVYNFRCLMYLQKAVIS